MNPPLQNQQIVEALAGFAAHEPPTSLYRFHSEAGLPALTDGMLKITPPREFNDPFELSPGVVTEGLTAEELRRNFLSATSLPRFVFAKRFPNEAAYRHWVDTVVVGTPHLWSKHLESLRGAVTSATSEVFGIACFSAFSESILNGPLGIRHWAMYANDHTGFAIEYDGRHPLLKILAASKWLFPVTYHDDRPIVGIAEFDDWTEQMSLRALRRWSEVKCRQAWGEEMEWRLICPLARDPQGRVEISCVKDGGRSLHFLHLWKTSGEPTEKRENATAIKRVILGVHVGGDLEQRIKAALKEPHLKHVELYRSNVCARNFALRTERVPI
jgi:hypothetical protein